MYGFVPNAGVEGGGSDRQGTYAEYVTACHWRLAKLSDNVLFEEGTALPTIGITAWFALVKYGGLKSRQCRFIYGGSGGVGHFAVQIAKTANAEVMATASDNKKVTRIRELGTDTVFDLDYIVR